jgi:hypothetical protein
MDAHMRFLNSPSSIQATSFLRSTGGPARSVMRCAILFVFIAAACSPRTGLPVAAGGVLDLSKMTYSEPIELEGEWGFFRNRFLPPTEDAAADRTMTVPGVWPSHGEPGTGFAT